VQELVNLRGNILILTDLNIMEEWIRNIAANKIGKNIRKLYMIEYSRRHIR
jgi:hypothetical protein